MQQQQGVHQGRVRPAQQDGITFHGISLQQLDTEHGPKLVGHHPLLPGAPI